MKTALPKVEVFFDCSSPWTYLGYVRLMRLEKELSASFQWNPILVGGVFNAVNDTVYEARSNPHPVKQRYYLKDLQDWARFVGVKIGQPSVFPVNSVRAMRGAFYAREQGRLHDYALAVFESYWGELNDISQPEEVRACAIAAGLDPEALLAASEENTYKSELRETTEALIRRGGFGSPTIYIDETDMYFGNDRLELIRARLTGSAG